jgi:hypothetical protein
MSAIAAFLLALAGAQEDCASAKSAAADVRKDLDAWAASHNPGCPLCTLGTVCREGFGHQEESRRKLEDWKKLHALLCAACASARCGAAEAAMAGWVAEAQVKHREKCRKCDPEKCDGWKLVQDDLRRRLEDWKREHPASCDKCAPSCAEWRRTARDITRRHEEAAAKHREKCANCRALGSCERTPHFKDELARDRAAAWERHGETCSCQKTERKR